MNDDEYSIRMILDAQEMAWNTGDSVSWGAPYSHDADFVNILGQFLQGRRAMVDRHAQIFSGPFEGSRVAITIRRFRKLGEALASIDTIHEVSGFQSLPPGIVATSTGKLRTLMKYLALKEAGSWQFVAAQNTAILPEQGSAARS